MDNQYVIWFIEILIAIQLLVTFRVLMSYEFSWTQKTIQILIIWIVPLVGALGCGMFLSSDRRVPRLRDTAFTKDNGDNPPGIKQINPDV